MIIQLKLYGLIDMRNMFMVDYFNKSKGKCLYLKMIKFSLPRKYSISYG